jgi:hypothetical protein
MALTLQEEEESNTALEHDPRWQLIERIVTARSFAKSTRLSSFLLYISRHTLNGRSDSLNEQVIGERVFERPVGYDPREDNIVRSHASRLRQRLETYFREEGAAEKLRVSIPRGSYVPSFERVEVSPPRDPFPILQAASQVDRPVMVTEARAKPSRPIFIAGVFFVVVIGLVAGMFALGHRKHPPAALHDGSPTHKLWAQMFRGDQDTLIVPADSSLVVLKQMTGHSVGLASYAGGKYLSDVSCRQPCDLRVAREIALHRYTSIADLEFAVTLTHLPEALPDRTRIRYVRDLQLDDLKQANLILVGSLESDPWLELFQDKMNFVLNDDESKGPLAVRNRNPQPGEEAEYLINENDPTHHAYATVAFMPNLDGTGNVLVVQGFTLAGTQAAAEFLTSGRGFDVLFAPLGPSQALPHFEVLLQTMDVNGSASVPKVVASRIFR